MFELKINYNFNNKRNGEIEISAIKQLLGYYSFEKIDYSNLIYNPQKGSNYFIGSGKEMGSHFKKDANYMSVKENIQDKT